MFSHLRRVHCNLPQGSSSRPRAAMAYKGTMPMPPMTLEVTVVSGESVRVRSGRALGGGAYAVVHTASSSARTHADEDGDCNGHPYWAEAVRVALPAGARALDVEICRAQSGGRVESVAEARVPVEDFTVGPPGHLHCLSYRLFDTGGLRRRNGIVNITVKRLDGAAPAEGKALVPATGKAADSGPGTSGSCCGVAADQGKTAPPTGVVMGYPVGF
ncbi:BON1-associated protein 2-like [Phragmites australis]|uniref:BON1-associated protein 2-like n=1 Tax=Phragmites australis TaxID=29695 RepID=UPI002D79692B|nr:BON1-associated protein 2-like [Phragmites australis]